ncbi:hypothetical protein DFH28DRAFT_893961 [Melampsora americana]|nr:hypothetical protein DFH28DRAFT_893961 [Melampsora americana]
MLPKPHGGVLCDLLLRDSSIRSDLLKESYTLPSITLSERSLCDLECIMNGAFSPLTGFMTQEDYENVLNSSRLRSGTLWTIPITLDITDEQIKRHSIKLGTRLVLKDSRDLNSLAILSIKSIWKPNKVQEALKVLNTLDPFHPSVNYLFHQTQDHYIGGELESIELPIHFDYHSLRFTPIQLRQKFEESAWKTIVGFQTRNPMHKAHVNLTLKALKEVKGNLLIHPVVGLTKPGDIDYHTRVKVYKAVLETYPKGLATLALLPLAMRMAGPREAVWHAIIRQNYGATHFIVGRDHAGPGKSSKGEEFYRSDEAQELIESYSNELKIKIIRMEPMIYLPKTNEYKSINELSNGIEFNEISGSELREFLKNDVQIPDWFSFQKVIEILKESYPPKNKQGFVIFLTGPNQLSKIKLSKALELILHESSSRSIKLLSDSNLPISFNPTETKEEEEESKMISFLSAELSKAGIAVISLISNHEHLRMKSVEYVRKNGGRDQNGMVILVYVSESVDRDEVERDEVIENGEVNGINEINGNENLKEFKEIGKFSNP